jgi:hypothetical protein
MLSREDSRRLAQLERQLLREDPEFCARMTDGHAASPRRRRPPISLILTAVVAWVAAIILAVVGWWIAAALAGACATVLLAAVVHRVNRMRPGKPDIPDSPAGLTDTP